jgi:hypothetical protein
MAIGRINDDCHLEDKERETQLIKLFEKHEIKVEFYN